MGGPPPCVRASNHARPAAGVSRKGCTLDHGGDVMKPLTIVGIVLIALGVIALAYQGVTYTTKENVIEVGPLKIEATKEKTIPLPPVLGGVAAAAGVVLMIVGARSR